MWLHYVVNNFKFATADSGPILLAVAFQAEIKEMKLLLAWRLFKTMHMQMKILLKEWQKSSVVIFPKILLKYINITSLKFLTLRKLINNYY